MNEAARHTKGLRNPPALVRKPEPRRHRRRVRPRRHWNWSKKMASLIVCPVCKYQHSPDYEKCPLCATQEAIQYWKDRAREEAEASENILKGAYQRVRAFHTKFQLPKGGAPTHLFAHEREARGKLIAEELVEFCSAQTMAAQADALTDLLIMTLGTFVKMGINPSLLFTVAMAANMKKSLPLLNGKPVKPAGWKHPDVEAVLRSMTSDALGKQDG